MRATVYLPTVVRVDGRLVAAELGVRSTAEGPRAVRARAVRGTPELAPELAAAVLDAWADLADVLEPAGRCACAACLGEVRPS